MKKAKYQVTLQYIVELEGKSADAAQQALDIVKRIASTPVKVDVRRAK